LNNVKFFFLAVPLIACNTYTPTASGELANCFAECEQETMERCRVDAVHVPFGNKNCTLWIQKCFTTGSSCHNFCDSCEQDNKCPDGSESCDQKCTDLVNTCVAIQVSERCFPDERNRLIDGCILPSFECTDECVIEYAR